MARYKGPRARICRRLDFPVFESNKFSSLRKNYPPGQHGDNRRFKLSYIDEKYTKYYFKKFKIFN